MKKQKIKTPKAPKKTVTKRWKFKKTFKLKALRLGKPNWLAIFLMAVLLIGSMSHFSEDVFSYVGAREARRELANEVEEMIRYNVAREDFDLSNVEHITDSIDQHVQNLSEDTDLGEYFAKNDLTEKGRKVNSLTVDSIILGWFVGMAYLAAQAVCVVNWLYEYCKKPKNNKIEQVEELSKTDDSVV